MGPPRRAADGKVTGFRQKKREDQPQGDRDEVTQPYDNYLLIV
jgi:hypothetical protein